jgi:hypothetical protein
LGEINKKKWIDFSMPPQEEDSYSSLPCQDFAHPSCHLPAFDGFCYPLALKIKQLRVVLILVPLGIFLTRY